MTGPGTIDTRTLLRTRLRRLERIPRRMLPPIADVKPVAALDTALADIAASHGERTSAFIALQLEYPQP